MLSLLNKRWGSLPFCTCSPGDNICLFFAETIPGDLEIDICSTSQKIIHCVFVKVSDLFGNGIWYGGTLHILTNALHGNFICKIEM